MSGCVADAGKNEDEEREEERNRERLGVLARVVCGDADRLPDGGHACADLRWYCKDSKACTDRWT